MNDILHSRCDDLEARIEKLEKFAAFSFFLLFCFVLFGLLALLPAKDAKASELIPPNDPVLNSYWVGLATGTDQGSYQYGGTVFFDVDATGGYTGYGYYNIYGTGCATKLPAWHGQLRFVSPKTYIGTDTSGFSFLVLMSKDTRSAAISMVGGATGYETDSNVVFRKPKKDQAAIAVELEQFTCVNLGK